jgi:hypothetical protein
MTDLAIELDEVVGMARGLSPLDKVRLVEEVMALLEADLASQNSGPARSFYGIWPDANISAEDIAQARHEMWGNFPRGDI